MDLSSLKKMLNVFESVSKGEIEIPHERMSAFLEKHKLLDLRLMEKVKYSILRNISLTAYKTSLFFSNPK